jgi:hypothetical protein
MEDTVTRTKGESVESRASDERVERIHAIGLKLAELTLLKTARSRARCRELAAEMIALLPRRMLTSGRNPLSTSSRQGFDRLRAALVGCREAVEQAQLTRLYTMSERMQCKKGDGSS